MNRFTRLLANHCDRCALCRYARENPESRIGRLMAWHGKWCPAWKAQMQLELERKGKA
ncbi:MAG: hypothetical protein ABFD98_09945 [Syntrophobacteraceae bacterium]|nr:hypothetical protein [Desulfobacteraceae bacterium]